MARASMPRSVPDAAVRTECERGPQSVRKPVPQELPLGDIAAKAHANREATRGANATDAMELLAPVFRRAIERWGKAEAYAEEIGVTKSTLSEMCAGKRLIG